MIIDRINIGNYVELVATRAGVEVRRKSETVAVIPWRALVELQRWKRADDSDA